MSAKERQKKDHKRKDKDVQAMKESSRPRKEQASIRLGDQKESKEDRGRRSGARRN